MSKEEGDKKHWLSQLAEKVPGDVAGPVLVIIVFLSMSPSILDKMQNEIQVYCYLAILAIVVCIQGISISLHAISRYHARERRSQFKTSVDFSITHEIASEVKKQIREAVLSMEENGQDE